MKQAGFRGRIGVAREDITPPVGIYSRNWGAARTDIAEGVHRPITLTALTLQTDADAKPLVLLGADLCGWWTDVDFEWACRHEWLQALGIDAANLMLNFAHNHGVPPMCRPRSEWEGGDLVHAYTQRVRDAVARTAKAALAAARPAVLEWRAGRCDLAANRDRPDGNRLVCGTNEQAPADDTLLVGRVTSEDGHILATVVNYACHATTLAWENQLLTPDFAGAMREVIEMHTDGAPAIFLQGASGDLGPRHGFVGDTAVADANGRQLGFAALSALSAMDPAGHEFVYDGVVESGAPLAVWKYQPATVAATLRAVRGTIDLELKDWPPALELAGQLASCEDRAMAERIRRKLMIREALGDAPTFALDYWVWQVGDALVIGALPESYSVLQQEIRAAFPDRAVICMNLVNGSIGYLVPAACYDLDLYQAWQTPFARGGQELLIDAFKTSIRQLLARQAGT